MLSFVVTPGDDYKNTTKGLLGTWNDNADDDFTLPDGTVLAPSLTSREIHFRFGLKCKFPQCLCNHLIAVKTTTPEATGKPSKAKDPHYSTKNVEHFDLSGPLGFGSTTSKGNSE